MSYKIYLLCAVAVFVVTVIGVCIGKTKVIRKNNESVETAINRTWMIETIIGLLVLILGIALLPWGLAYVLILLGVAFLLVFTLLFESFMYVFDDNGITFVGVCFKLAYIKYEDVRDIFQRWEWFMDSLILSKLTQYYEIYGPAEEKFKFYRPLQITKTKKTRDLLKKNCPKRFSKPKEKNKKFSKSKNKKHSKK